MPTDLHEQRLITVMQSLLDSRAKSILDLGCGRGELLAKLADEEQFKKIVAVDVSIDALSAAENNLGPQLAGEGDRIALLQGSFAEKDSRLVGFDAAVLLESIEHIEPDRLSMVERAVFGCYRPGTVLITTPNEEYNVLYNKPKGQTRHPDHRFEWPREKFEAWASGVANRNGYRVAFAGIGSAHPTLGCSTQMAQFRLREVLRS